MSYLSKIVANDENIKLLLKSKDDHQLKLLEEKVKYIKKNIGDSGAYSDDDITDHYGVFHSAHDYKDLTKELEDEGDDSDLYIGDLVFDVGFNHYLDDKTNGPNADEIEKLKQKAKACKYKCVLENGDKDSRDGAYLVVRVKWKDVSTKERLAEFNRYCQEYF